MEDLCLVGIRQGNTIHPGYSLLHQRSTSHGTIRREISRWQQGIGSASVDRSGNPIRCFKWNNLGHRTREYRARNVDPFCALYSTAEFGPSTQGGRFIFPYHIGKNVGFTVISISRDHDLSN